MFVIFSEGLVAVVFHVSYSNLLSAQSKVRKEFWTLVLHFLRLPETFEVFVPCKLQELNRPSRI